MAEHFLETTATQLSYHGLCELNAAAKEGEMCVFFRNNHFSTMIKHKVAPHEHTHTLTFHAWGGGAAHAVIVCLAYTINVRHV